MARLEASSRRQRMDPGVLNAAVERFAAHLAGLGHTPLTVADHNCAPAGILSLDPAPTDYPAFTVKLAVACSTATAERALPVSPMV